MIFIISRLFSYSKQVNFTICEGAIYNPIKEEDNKSYR